MKKLGLLTLFLVSLLEVKAQNLIQFKQIQQATLNGQVLVRQSGVWTTDSLDFNFLKNKPAVGVGSVTSVGLSMPTGFTVTNSPITGAGTLTVSTTLNGPLRGNGTGFVVGNLNAATELTGIVPIANGGTGLSTSGANGNVLISNGTIYVSTAPPWITANQTITLTGDVTGSGTTSIATTIAANAVTTTKIANSNVTYAKIQNVTAARILGNPTGSAAAPSEISLGTGLSFVGSVLTIDNSTVSGVDTTAVKNIISGDIAAGIVTIPLGATPRVNTHVIVFVNGVKADVSAVSTSGTNALITQASLPYTIAAGDRVEVLYTK